MNATTQGYIRFAVISYFFHFGPAILPSLETIVRLIQSLTMENRTGRPCPQLKRNETTANRIHNNSTA